MKFIKKSKMTKRTKNTWIKNNMTSVNVKDGNKIIGVLPFEKIHLKVKRLRKRRITVCKSIRSNKKHIILMFCCFLSSKAQS